MRAVTGWSSLSRPLRATHLRCRPQTVVEVRAERASKPRKHGTQPTTESRARIPRFPLWIRPFPDRVVSVVGSRFLSMSSATDAPDATDLDVRAALLEAAEARRTADQQEARLLALAVQIVHLHPVDDEDLHRDLEPLSIAGRGAGAGRRDRHPAGGRACGRGARRRPRRLLPRRPRPGRPTRWSCATACLGCGHWSRPGCCRRGRPARSPSRPPTWARRRWRSSTPRQRSPEPRTGSPRTCPAWSTRR